MMDLVMGIVFFAMPGIVPICIQSGIHGIRKNPARQALLACLYDFVSLICAYGVCLLVFGQQLFSPHFGTPENTFAAEYVLFYIVYLVAAYMAALFLSLVKSMFAGERIVIKGYSVALTLYLGILAVGIGYDAYAGSHVMISEVCSNNLTITLDRYGESSDYIELYNPSSTSVSLEGFMLTQKEGTEGVYLDGYYLEPHSYLLLFADGRAETEENSVALQLGAEGEELYLYDSGGDCIDQVTFPKLPADIVYARMGQDMETWDTTRYGSPGEDNLSLTACKVPCLEQPVLSAASGFYDEAFLLSMQCRAGETIYYTMDGSMPTTQSEIYEEPVLIQDASVNDNYYAALPNLSIRGDYVPGELLDKACVVRAICANDEGKISDISTAVYFVGFQDKEGYDAVKIMALNAEPEDLFSDQRGIYVLGGTYESYLAACEEPEYTAYTPANYLNRGRMWERTAGMTLFDSEKDLILEGQVGIRIHGGSTRSYRQKGFNFYGREKYGEETMEMGGYMLRTSGAKDTYLTMLRDVFGQSLVEDRAVAMQRGEPCVLFLNGEYWGLYNLQERYSADYFEEHYGISEDNLIVLKDSRANDVTTTRVTAGREADKTSYDALVQYAQENELCISECYEEICTMMDVQSFIDYFVTEMYLGNTDWPVNNVCRFKSREVREGSAYEDGRWRWALYDTDESTGGGSTGYDMNPFEGETYYHKVSPMDTELMAALLENETFRQQFCVTFMDMINKNFAYSQVRDKLYEMADVYALPMVNSYHRFSQEEYTVDTFWDNIAVLDEYMQNRPVYIIPYLTDAMGLSGVTGQVTLQTACLSSENMSPGTVGDYVADTAVELSSEGGYIVLNTIMPMPEQGEWQGIYLTDYPVVATAVAKKGYRFVGWQGSYESTEETIEADVTQEGICLRAVFEAE